VFDKLALEPEALVRGDDAAVVSAIEEWNRIEAAAGARRLHAIAELTRRRCEKEGKRAEWACDGWDSAAAEVAAAMGLRHNKASSQMQIALALRDRLPKVLGLYLEGKVSYRVVSAIVWHTDLVTADEPMASIDAALAKQAALWGRLSDYKLDQAIEAWVDRYDPGALRRIQSRAKTRCLHVGHRDDKSDLTSVWGRLYATDAEVIKRRLTEMAHGVCDDDPRTMAQRNADALGALAAGADRLACLCGDPNCPSGGDDGRASNVVVHVVAHEAAVADKPDPEMNGEAPQANTPEAKPGKPPAALLMRGGILPTPLLAELIKHGAKVRPVPSFADAAPEPRYTPSAGLQQFVRCRDLTCRFPGCEAPAEFCDVDHTIPDPVGPTHPSNLKCLCRKHHLLKTFWSGWGDQQLPDGTVVWTTPTGRTYKTLPGSRIFFPAWDATTAT